jgi:CRP/FNR family cyclic AMP-dependent transcriptional regulator
MREFLELCKDAPREIRPDGDVLLREGETTNRLYVVVSGKVEVLRGATQVAVLGEPGSVVGDMSILMQSPHTATARALGEVEVITIEDASGFFRAYPEAAYHVARMLAHRLNAATTYLADIKRQYAGQGDHLAMVGDVLESLIYRQRPRPEPGSERDARAP